MREAEKDGMKGGKPKLRPILSYPIASNCIASCHMSKRFEQEQSGKAPKIVLK